MLGIRTQKIASGEIEIDYCPHDGQKLVHANKARFRVVVCGRRWGKTTLAINELIKEATTGFNKDVFFIAPTYRQAKMIAFEMLKAYLPREAIVSVNVVDLEFSLLNGSRISIKGAENEDSLRGVGLNFVVLDEYAQMKPNVWQEIIRPMLTDTKGRALFIGTPKGKNSLFDLFLKGQRHEDGYSSYRFKTVDNPFIDPDEIEQARKQLTDRYFKQEYEASFEDYVGLIYPEFDHKLHLVEQFPIPNYWETIATIDPAMTGTTAALFCAINEEGEIYITSEYYEQNKRVSEVCEVIKNKAKHWYIDPASKDKTIPRMGNLYSLFDEYGDNGIYPTTAENDVDAGINRVAEYFKNGKLKIFKNCTNLIYELERYHWSEEKETRTGLLKPKPFKSMDHAVDCLRYLIMTRPSAVEQPTPHIQHGSVAELMLKQESEANNWRDKYH